MAYDRIVLRTSDKNNRSDAHDRIYGQLDKLLGPYIGVGKDTHEGALDTKFFVDEISDNFLRYDSLFTKVEIDLSIDSATLDVELKVKHDGNDFDPLSPAASCPKIKAAAERLHITPQSILVGDTETLRFKFKYNLKAKVRK